MISIEYVPSSHFAPTRLQPMANSGPPTTTPPEDAQTAPPTAGRGRAAGCQLLDGYSKPSKQIETIGTVEKLMGNLPFQNILDM